MVEFKNLEVKEVETGSEIFFQVARRKAISGERENEFISINRGRKNKDEGKEITNNMIFPAKPVELRKILKAVQEVSKLE